MKPKLLNSLFTAGLLLALVACNGQSPGPAVIRVALNEFTIELDKSAVPAGLITFEIENVGATEHELVLEPSGAYDEPFETGGKASEVEGIQPGSTVSFEWTLEPGEYQLACYVGGHFEAGMYSSLTVTD